MSKQSYQPIENYGIVGNMNTVALVGKNASIDWFCYPHFDSPSIFARILDYDKGGYFTINPIGHDVSYKQIYWPDTNVLVTRLLSKDGVAEIIDYMPVEQDKHKKGYHMLIRRVNMIHGSMKFRLECFPRFDYARAKHKTTISEDGAAFITENLTMALTTKISLSKQNNGVTCEFTMNQEETLSFTFHELKKGQTLSCYSHETLQELFYETINYWHKWISKCTYKGRWREMVHRSALVLKLLTFDPTGAIVASPTTSLPEEIGGKRNWDYRYTWVRDAAFTLYGLLRIGFSEEAERFMEWILNRCEEKGDESGPLQIMYKVGGGHELEEETLDHLEGYKKSPPVRIGNGAAHQLQLDIYGELIDSIYLYNKYGKKISYDMWTHIRRIVDWVCSNWNREDEGIWEVRGGKKHFTYSKLMCWVAIDRAIRIATKRSFPADKNRWYIVRDEIYESIMSRGWNKDKQAFTQFFGSDTLDASVLVMPLVHFVAPHDPRMLRTLEAINQPPHKGGLVSNSLVYRYDTSHGHDGIEGNEGTFNMCTFWLVEALTRAGKVEEARNTFEQMLGYANHLGLYAEETGHSGEALGNFPQAFTHLAVISAAVNLDLALDKKG